MSTNTQRNPTYDALSQLKRTVHDSTIASVIEFSKNDSFDFNYFNWCALCDDMGWTPIDDHVFEAKSYDDKIAYFKSFNLSGFPSEWQPRLEPLKRVIDVSQPKGSTAANPRATVLSAMYCQAKGNVQTQKMIEDLAPNRALMDVGSFKQHLGSLISYLQAIPDEVPLGALSKDLTTYEYQMWRDQNKGEVVLLGPLTIWKTLERFGVEWRYVFQQHDDYSYLEFTRNGKVLECYNKNEVVTPVGEPHGEYVNQFLDGLKSKGKPVVYDHISITALYMAGVFFTKFQANQKGKGQRISFTPINPKDNQVPRYSKRLLDMLDSFLPVLEDVPIVTKQPDVLHEKIARAYAAWRDPKEQDLDQDSLLGNYAAVDKLWKTAAQLCEDIKKKSVEDRIKAFATQLGATPNIDKAMDIVEKSRKKIRNVTEESRLVTSQSGSVHGSLFDSWFDTATKGEHIVSYLDRMKVVTTPETKINCYGVAYGHMSDAIRKLRHHDAPSNTITWYDNKKATNSTEQFERTDVFVHAAPGWVIDDTNAHKVPDHLKNENKGINGDMLKIKRFIAAGAPVIVSKMNMHLNWRVNDHLTWKKLLFHDNTFHTVRLVKFGKLHNPEAFLVLIREERKVCKDTWENLSADLTSIALCTSVMDQLITTAHLSGRRYTGTAAVIDVDAKGIATKDPTKINGQVSVVFTPRDAMLALLAALPTKWMHYFDCIVKNIEYKGGASIMVQDLATGDDVPVSRGDEDTAFFDDMVSWQSSGRNWNDI